ncbi:MAG: ribosome silencing factor [Christensenellaceae bacterium]|nr:ribosome silencing factor [Christensenellaceae bacterium]
MNSKDLVTKIAEILDSKDARDIETIDVSEKTIIGDYFIIATGANVQHVRALTDHVEEKLSEDGIEPLRKEGREDGRWCVMDYGSVIVHVFVSTTRKFFDLEKLWA